MRTSEVARERVMLLALIVVVAIVVIFQNKLDNVCASFWLLLFGFLIECLVVV